MASELTFDDLVAPITDLGDGDPLECWKWLAGADAKPLLLTALGDLFVTSADGTVQFLDTYEGSVTQVAMSYTDFKEVLKNSSNIDRWFLPNLVQGIRERGILLQTGQCYSPIHPPVLGGKMDPQNFEVVSWRVHFVPMGQIHEQLKDIPPGTPITGIEVEWR